MARSPVVIGLALIAIQAFAGSAPAQETIPAPVFVTFQEAPLPPPLKPEQHQALIMGARNVFYNTLEAALKQHGDKREGWPPAAVEAVDDAHDAWTIAQARAYYSRPESQLGLDSSVADFLRGADKNKKMAVVSTASEAALVVAITGRRRTEPAGITDNRYFIRFRLMAGPLMAHARFLELTRKHDWEAVWSKLFARAKDNPNYVDLEAGSMASYKNCAAAVRAIVENFIWQQMDPSSKKKEKE